MGGGVEWVILMASSNYGTGHRRVIQLGLIVLGRLIFISMGDYAGSWCGKGKSMPGTGL